MIVQPLEWPVGARQKVGRARPIPMPSVPDRIAAKNSCHVYAPDDVQHRFAAVAGCLNLWRPSSLFLVLAGQTWHAISPTLTREFSVGINCWRSHAELLIVEDTNLPE